MGAAAHPQPQVRGRPRVRRVEAAHQEQPGVQGQVDRPHDRQPGLQGAGFCYALFWLVCCVLSLCD